MVVARELTKLHEEVWRGTLEEAAGEFAAREVRGEVVVVLGGATAAAAAREAEVVARRAPSRGRRGELALDAADGGGGRAGRVAPGRLRPLPWHCGATSGDPGRAGTASPA